MREGAATFLRAACSSNLASSEHQHHRSPPMAPPKSSPGLPKSSPGLPKTSPSKAGPRKGRSFLGLLLLSCTTALPLLLLLLPLSALRAGTLSTLSLTHPDLAALRHRVPGFGRSREVQARAAELLREWTELYRLQEHHPPGHVHVAGGGVPPAPHLQECTAVTAHRERQEMSRGFGAQYPEWACTSTSRSRSSSGSSSSRVPSLWSSWQRPRVVSCQHPSPPWVSGSDADNLPLTRVAQRDLWVRQFPPGDCSDPALRFLLVDWWPEGNHGIGSQLHLMSAALSIAYASGRILVPTPHSFQRANHSRCLRPGHRGSLDCYFFPVTSEQCTARAWALASALGPQAQLETVSPRTLSAPTRALHIRRPRVVNGQMWEPQWNHYLEASAALSWGRPWAHQPAPFELLGRTQASYEDSLGQVNWWRSQSMRFILRWPSAYLCHVMNQVRHEAFGAAVAERMAKAEVTRVGISSRKHLFLDPKEPLRLLEQPGKSALGGGEPLELTPQWRLDTEPYMPRPIVSVHVRQGDKAKEMELFSLPSFMWLAERVRLLDPHVRRIWLSTEMQSVVDDTAQYKDWEFLFSRIKRQVGNASMISYEEEVGMEEEVGSSFANLVIASQCDHFVGVLGSNWNRLINELRLTNGRRRASYMTLNHAEW